MARRDHEPARPRGPLPPVAHDPVRGRARSHHDRRHRGDHRSGRPEAGGALPDARARRARPGPPAPRAARHDRRPARRHRHRDGRVVAARPPGGGRRGDGNHAVPLDAAPVGDLRDRRAVAQHPHRLHRPAVARPQRLLRHRGVRCGLVRRPALPQGGPALPFRLLDVQVFPHRQHPRLLQPPRRGVPAGQGARHGLRDAHRSRLDRGCRRGEAGDPTSARVTKSASRPRTAAIAW